MSEPRLLLARFAAMGYIVIAENSHFNVSFDQCHPSLISLPQWLLTRKISIFGTGARSDRLETGGEL